MTGSNVVYLKFQGDQIAKDTMALGACTPCGNKTFNLLYDKPDHFPLLRCAACGCHMGRIGWAET